MSRCEFISKTFEGGERPCTRTAAWRADNGSTSLDLCNHHYDFVLRRRNVIAAGSYFKATPLRLLPEDESAQILLTHPEARAAALLSNEPKESEGYPDDM